MNVSVYLISIDVAQVLTKTPPTEMTKESTRPLPSSASSTSSRTSVDEGGSESGSPASLSTKQLVYIAADVQKLQEKVRTVTQTGCIHSHPQIYLPAHITSWTWCHLCWHLIPRHCPPSEILFVFLVDTRVVRNGQMAVRGRWIQKLCGCRR